MSHERVVAIAADYADALLVARRAQRTLLLLLLLILLAQVAIFCTAHFAPQVLHPSEATTQPANWSELLRYFTQASLHLAMIFAALLSLVLFLTIHVMLVGRLIGVAYVTRAFTLSVLLAFLLFPWQTLLVTGDLTRTDAVIPGVLYTWREVREHVPMHDAEGFDKKALYWGRFLAMPLVAIAMLLVVQTRSGRGLKLALGEEELLPVDAEQTTVVATVR